MKIKSHPPTACQHPLPAPREPGGRFKTKPTYRSGVTGTYSSPNQPRGLEFRASTDEAAHRGLATKKTSLSFELRLWIVLLALCNLPLFGGNVTHSLILFPDAVAGGEWWRLFSFPLEIAMTCCRQWRKSWDSTRIHSGHYGKIKLSSN